VRSESSRSLSRIRGTHPLATGASPRFCPIRPFPSMTKLFLPLRSFEGFTTRRITFSYFFLSRPVCFFFFFFFVRCFWAFPCGERDPVRCPLTTPSSAWRLLSISVIMVNLHLPLDRPGFLLSYSLPLALPSAFQECFVNLPSFKGLLCSPGTCYYQQLVLLSFCASFFPLQGASP